MIKHRISTRQDVVPKFASSENENTCNFPTGHW
jgi:hypothetical protein